MAADIHMTRTPLQTLSPPTKATNNLDVSEFHHKEEVIDGKSVVEDLKTMVDAFKSENEDPLLSLSRLFCTRVLLTTDQRCRIKSVRFYCLA